MAGPMSEPPKFSYDVFLSHNHADKPRVRQLAGKLRTAGLSVWYDEWIIKPGDDIYLAIERGLQTARTLVLCLSPAALGSEWVGLERSTVLFRDPSNAGRRFIPLLLEPCDLPDTLRRYSHVDYRKGAAAEFKKLLKACHGAKQQAASTGKAGDAGPPAGGKIRQVRRDRKLPPEDFAPADEAKQKSPQQPQPLAVLERTLTGHRELVTSVAVSPDGKWVVSSSDDCTVKIWDLETGKCRATLKHKVAWVASRSRPMVRRYFQAQSTKKSTSGIASEGRLMSSWIASESNIISLAVLPDGRRLVSGGAIGDANPKALGCGDAKVHFKAFWPYKRCKICSADPRWKTCHFGFV